VSRYRKKPVEVEAHQFDGTAASATQLINWMLDNDVTARYREAESFTEGTALHTSARLSIDVPEGTLHAFPGDWVIHIGPGLFSPCTADDFAETYEAVS